MSVGAIAPIEKPTKLTFSSKKRAHETDRKESKPKKGDLEFTCESDAVKFDEGKLYSRESLFPDAGNERDFGNTVASLEVLSPLERKNRLPGAQSPANGTDRELYANDTSDSTAVHRSDSCDLSDSRGDSRFRDLERETGTSLTCLASLNSHRVEFGLSPCCLHSVGVQRTISQGHPKDGRKNRLKSKSCDNLQIKKNCDCDSANRDALNVVTNSREIDKRNKKNRLFSFPVSSNSNNCCDHDASDSKKKRKFIIILKGVLNCQKKKKLAKAKEAEQIRQQQQQQCRDVRREPFPALPNYDRSPSAKRNYSRSSGNLNENADRRSRGDQLRLEESVAKLSALESPAADGGILKTCSVENVYLIRAKNADENPSKCRAGFREKNVNEDSDNGGSIPATSTSSAIPADIRKDIDAADSSKPKFPEEAASLRVPPSTHDFLTALYHESLLQRFADAPPSDRCLATEAPTAGECRPTPETAPITTTCIPESPDRVSPNYVESRLNGSEFDCCGANESEQCSDEEQLIASSSKNCSFEEGNLCLTENVISDDNSFNVNLEFSEVTKDFPELDAKSDHELIVSEETFSNNCDDVENNNNLINQSALVDALNHNLIFENSEDSLDLLDNRIAGTNFGEGDPLVGDDQVTTGGDFYAQEETFSVCSSVIDSDSFYDQREHQEVYDVTSDDDDSSNDDISDDDNVEDSSDSSVDYDVTPIDDKYFDLHYDPYYYHGSYSLDDVPVDQPIDYPSPYVVPSVSHIDSNTGNWWQQFDGKPGRELYRSQSQPKDLGCPREEEPLDGNLPLHLFLSASQPLGNNLSPIIKDRRSNSLESLNSSRRRSEFGSFCSSFGSHLYTIAEELETDEELPAYKFGSCINFGEENFLDFETSNSCEDFRISKYAEEVRRSFSLTSEHLVDINEITETRVLSYPDERYLLHSEAEGPEMKVEEDTYIRSASCSSENFTANSSSPELVFDANSCLLEDNVNRFEDSSLNKSDLIMSEVCHGNGLPTPVYANVPINKRLSRSSPSIVAECEGSSSRDFMDFNYFPTAAKRYNIPNGENEIHTYQNLPLNSKMLESDFTKENIFTMNNKLENGVSRNGIGRFSEKISDDSNDSDYESNFNSDKYSMMNPEMDRHSLSSSDEYLPTSKSLSEAMSNSVTSGNFSLNLNCDFSFDDKGLTPSCFTSGVPSFSAYSSDTSLDFDTFSKSGKVFKWNGSSSISDLTSLSKEFDKKGDDLPARGSSSTSDLSTMTKSDTTSEYSLGRTSYMQWSAQVKDDIDNDEEEMALPLNLRSNSSFVFTPHAQNKRNTHMSFYGGRPPPDTLNSDDDHEGDSEEASSSSGSDSAEDDGVMRSYHIGPSHSGYGLGMSESAGLATIAEDVEEDSGGESSSGHWLFSADNTDTDSVIHVPPPLALPSPLPIQYENELGQYSSSEETLVASEDEVIVISDTSIRNAEIWKNAMNTSSRSVIRKSNEEIRGNPNEIRQVFSDPKGDDQMTEKLNFHNLSSFDANEDAFEKNETRSLAPKLISSVAKNILQTTSYSFDTSSIRRDVTNAIDVCNNENIIEAKFLETKCDRDVHQQGIPSFSLSNKTFETQIDDIFDFSSLDTCEEVSLSVYGHGVESEMNNKGGIEESTENPVIFNTSATSQPFCDYSIKKPEQLAKGEAPVLKLNENLSDKVSHFNTKTLEANKNEENGNDTNASFCDLKESKRMKESDRMKPQAKDTQLRELIKLNGDTYLDKVISETHSVNGIPNRFSHSSSDEEMNVERRQHSTDLNSIQTSASEIEISSVAETETTGDASKTMFRSGENIHGSSVSNQPVHFSLAGAGKQKRSQRTHQRIRARNILRHSETSDGDTDDTDGDCEEENQCYNDDEKEMQKLNSKHALHEQADEGAESENRTHPQKVSSFIDSCPEVPPSKDIIKDHRIGASANFRDCVSPPVERLGEGSKFVCDQSSLLTSSFCEPSLTKQVNRVKPLVRPLSLGDLRYYSSDSSDSEPEIERNCSSDRTMQPRIAMPHPAYARRQFASPPDAVNNSSVAFTSRSNGAPLSPAHSSSHHRPKRHQSLYSPPTRENGSRPYSVPNSRRSIQRPKPLSLDMAEEFLSQEGLQSPDQKYINPYVSKIHGAPNQINRVSVNANSDAMSKGKNENGNNNTNMRRESQITTSTPDLTEETTWLCAQNQPLEQFLPATLPLNSREPQFPFDSDGSNVRPWQVSSGNSLRLAPHSSDFSHLERNNNIALMRTLEKEGGEPLPCPDPDMDGRVNSVSTKTFSPREEVCLEKPSNVKGLLVTKRGSLEDAHSKHVGSRGVRFSPKVEEVKWRENYVEPDADDTDYLFTQMEEKKVQKVKVVSSESPPLQKLTPKVTSFFSPPDDNHLSANKQINQTNQTSEVEIRNLLNNGSKSERPCEQTAPIIAQNNISYDSSETQQIPTPESPRSPTPIWQRLKLVKIGSPKGPRPKIPPKPPSLSPRSSDGETHKVSSCSSPESGLSSPSSPEFKFKKIPTSPRFFSWGSKKEKKDKKNKNGDNSSKATSAPPLDSVSPASSSPSSPTFDYPQVNRKETQVEGPFILNNGITAPYVDELQTKEREPKESKLPDQNNELKISSGKAVNGYHQSRNVEANENDFLKTRESILKQLKSGRPNLNKAPPVEPRNNLNTSASPSTPSLSISSDSDSVLDDVSSTPPSSGAKPPLPPSFQNRGGSLSKSRAQNVRRQYLTPGRANEELNKECQPQYPSEDVKELTPPRLVATLPPTVDCAYRSRGKSASERLKERFERFSKATRAERERLARSTPDLSQIEESVRRLKPRIDWVGNRRSDSSPHSGSDGDATGLSSVTREEVRSSHRSSLRGGEAPYRSTFTRVNAEFERISLRNRTRSVGLLETDLDTGTSTEVLTPQETNLDDLYQDLQNFLESLPQVPLIASAPKEKTRAKSQSLRQLDAALDSPQVMEGNLAASMVEDSRAKSMEFLLDDNNRAATQLEMLLEESLSEDSAPENELMKEGERKVSEAELRVRRSLQRLDVPEWMKTANTQQGFLLRRRDPATGASSGGWSAFSSKTGSMTSLGSSKANTPNTPTKVVIPTRMSTRSYGGITSPSSTASISPSPSDKGSMFQYPLSRWSTSRINSGTTTPTGSFTSQRTASYTTYTTRQPYLGWRSNTSLTSLGGSQSSLTTSSYLSPAERLALTVIPSHTTSHSTQVSRTALDMSQEESERSPSQKLEKARAADVHSSIKEVTSAIVHYCTETDSPHPSPRASPNPSNRAPSPRRRVWVESSFVGSRPITSPETPTSSLALTPPPINDHHQQDMVDTRPPHLSDTFNFTNFFTGDFIREEERRSPTAIANNKIAASIDNDCSTALHEITSPDSQNSIEVHPLTLEGDPNPKMTWFIDRLIQSENSSRHSTADTIDSFNSRNSADSITSRDSSCGREGSKEELPASAGSCDEIPDEVSEGLQPPLPNSNFLSLTDDSTLTASCHSSFGTFQLEEEVVPKLPEVKPTKVKLEVATSLTGDTKQSINSRRFSEGASPWEPSSQIPYDKKSKRLDTAWDMDDDSQGYGFNFSSYTNNKDTLLTTDIEQESQAESTTLEDVLDSLLALPSASRSPSPSGGPHPLSLVRPYTPYSFPSNENSSASDPVFSQVIDLPMEDNNSLSFLRNHDFGTDPKTESYHKSISYPNSSFPSSSSSNQPNLECLRNRSLTSQDSDKTSVTFYLGKDEDDCTSAPQTAQLSPFKSTKVPIPNLENDDLSTACPESKVFVPAQDAHSLSSQNASNLSVEGGWDDHSNTIHLLRNYSYRASEAVEIAMPEKKTLVASRTAKEHHKEAKVTFHLPPKHMNIPPDSSSENGNGSENLRVDLEDDDDAPSSSDPIGTTVFCRNHLCSNSATVEEARANYKTCHNCSVFYCSRECRKKHWEKHKKFCENIRATTAAREVVDRVRENASVVEFLSAVARRGILSVGRGAVKIFFADATAAEKFVADGNIHEAHYQALQNIMPQEMGSEIYRKLIQQCRNYNPNSKFILYVSICTFSEPPTVSSSKFRRETVGKCAKMRLAEQNTQPSISASVKPSTRPNNPECHVITRDLNEPETLLLTAFPDSNYGLPPRQSREVALSNIVRELQARGVNIKTQYADVYRKLNHYVDVGGCFPPLTIYPKDSRRGSSFMCIIMPEADPSRLQKVDPNDSKMRTVDISRPHPAFS